MSIELKLTRLVANSGPTYTRPSLHSKAKMVGLPRILLIGIFAADRPNHVIPLVEEYASSRFLELTQLWVGMKGEPPTTSVARQTVLTLDEYLPKWRIVNQLLNSLESANYDYIIVSDDDILVGAGFLDQLIAEQQSLDFALAQPARTWRSYTDHRLVRRRLFTRARQTNFVESGPVVSFRRDFFHHVFPFSMESPMGWGYDLTWPIVAARLGFKIGIIDCVPVDHSLRPRSELYDAEPELHAMARYLCNREHIIRPRTLRVFR